MAEPMHKTDDTVFGPLTMGIHKHPLFSALGVMAALILLVFVYNHHFGGAQATGSAGTNTGPGDTGAQTGYTNAGYTIDVYNQYPQSNSATQTSSSSSGSSTGTAHAPGTTFYGPSGVHHYVTTGGMTLSQIANALGLKSWNSIYAIPDNQKLFGKMNAKSASGYAPGAGQVITIP